MLLIIIANDCYVPIIMDESSWDTLGYLDNVDKTMG